MPFEAAAVSFGVNLLGNTLLGGSASGAANTRAGSELQAGQAAAEAQKFRPVGVTTNFGTSNFQFDPNGYLTGAGYTLDPRLQSVQGGLLNTLPQTEQDVANIQAMGRQYMAQSPQQAAQQWMQNQQALLAPSRQTAQAQLNDSLFTKGTGGLSVAQGGGLGMANPQQQALLNAQAMQDLQLAAQAQQAGQQQYTFGQGLLTSAYSPLQTQLGTSQSVEQLGAGSLDLGAQLGGRSAAAGANVGNSLLQSGLASAKTAQSANAYNPLGTALTGLASNQALTSGIANWLSSSTPGASMNSYDPNGYGMGSWGTVDTAALPAGSYR